MYVCLCKAVTDTQIRQAVDDGAKSIKDLRRNLGVSSQCGRCSCTAKDLLKEYKQEIAQFDSSLWTMA